CAPNARQKRPPHQASRRGRPARAEIPPRPQAIAVAAHPQHDRHPTTPAVFALEISWGEREGGKAPSPRPPRGTRGETPLSLRKNGAETRTEARPAVLVEQMIDQPGAAARQPRDQRTGAGERL